MFFCYYCFAVFFFSGRVSAPYMSAYNSSKFAFEAFSDSLRLEVKPWNISVHIIEPTFYKTGIISEEILKKRFNKVWIEQPQQTRDEIGEEQFKSCKSNFKAYPFGSF